MTSTRTSPRRLLAELPVRPAARGRWDPRHDRGGEVAACDQLRARPFPADDPAQRQRSRGRGRGVLRTRPGARPRAIRGPGPDPHPYRAEHQADGGPHPAGPPGTAAGAGTRPHGRDVPRQACAPSSRRQGLMIRASGPAASSWTATNWPLSFDRWPLRESTETEAVQHHCRRTGPPSRRRQARARRPSAAAEPGRPAVPRRRAAGHEPASRSASRSSPDPRRIPAWPGSARRSCPRTPAPPASSHP